MSNAAMTNRGHIELLSTALLVASSASAADVLYDLHNQSLPTPFYGQHVGVATSDLNGDGAADLLFAAGRHWVDQSYALINLGPQYDENGNFVGVRFSEALHIGPPGSYYQIDVVSPSSSNRSSIGLQVEDDGLHQSTVLLVGGTCHFEEPNSFGSCKKGENSPARILQVSMSKRTGCTIHSPDAPCHLEYTEIWEHPNPKGDRNGGFASFGNQQMIALLGQGGIELFQPQSIQTDATSKDNSEGQTNFLGTSYSSAFHHIPPPKTDPRSDYSRYAGFASGKSPKLGGVVAAGRRSDYDAPQKDDDGNLIGINQLVYKDGGRQSFQSSTLPSTVSGEPYPGNPEYSMQTTNYAFADINGDGIQDLLEATFLYKAQLVPGYPLPQRVHFMDEEGHVKDTLVILEDGAREHNWKEDEDAGRSVTTGQIFSDSALPDVVFASAEGVVTLFANLGVDNETGKFRGLEQRYQLSVGMRWGRIWEDLICQVRDVAVTKLAAQQQETISSSIGKCWIGIVCAVTCGIDVLGKNHIFYVEGTGGVVCNDASDDTTTILTKGEVLVEKEVQ